MLLAMRRASSSVSIAPCQRRLLSHAHKRKLGERLNVRTGVLVDLSRPTILLDEIIERNEVQQFFGMFLKEAEG